MCACVQAVEGPALSAALVLVKQSVALEVPGPRVRAFVRAGRCAGHCAGGLRALEAAQCEKGPLAIGPGQPLFTLGRRTDLQSPT